MSAPASSEGLARQIAGIADAKGAEDIVALDVRGLVGYTDYLLVATARNQRQAKAIQEEVQRALKDEGRLPSRTEGVREADWMLIDYLDCVLHVMTPETRDRYRLEQLWGEAPSLDLTPRRPLAADG
ncbi:MAG: ribosome-associated protein [Solirubrobacterales bacterium]|nr:ribosome-associated protein [Solirubrobacterales bacterium]